MDSRPVSMQTTVPPRDAVHAPLDVDSAATTPAPTASSVGTVRNPSTAASSNIATFTQATAALSKRLEDVTVSITTALARSALPAPSPLEVPEFRGFKDDPTLWIHAINSLARRHAWPEDVTMSLAKSRPRDAAKAWHRYHGSAYTSWAEWSAALVTAFSQLPSAYDDRFMCMRSRQQAPTEAVALYVYEKVKLLEDCGITWLSPAARQYVVDGLLDSTHAAILSAQPPETSPYIFARKAAELQQTTRRAV